MRVVKCLSVLFASGLVAGAAVAHASDLKSWPAASPASDYAPVPIINWTGFYGGGFVGGAHGLWTIDFDRNDNHGRSEQGADGFAGGVWAGYNYQVGPQFVIGVEADIGATTARQSNAIFDNDTSLFEYGPFGSARARVGYAFDRLLVFGTAGLAFARITNTIQKGENAGEQIVYENQWRTGYAVGGGLEYAFARNLFGRFEYLYSNYGTVMLTNRDGDAVDFTNELHLLRIGLSYRF